MRIALFAAALNGCSASVVPIWEVPKKPPKSATVPAPAKVSPCKDQACLVERARKDCKNDQCMDEKLIQEFEFPGEERSYSISVKEGEEVFSLVVGDSSLAMLTTVTVKKIDEKGVGFGYTQKQTIGFDLSRAKTDGAEFRVNFDGSTNGEIWKIEPLEIWGLTVEKSDKGATVSFSTSDNRIAIFQTE